MAKIALPGLYINKGPASLVILAGPATQGASALGNCIVAQAPEVGGGGRKLRRPGAWGASTQAAVRVSDKVYRYSI